jgi:quercetin 2,3-dioxygenase
LLDEDREVDGGAAPGGHGAAASVTVDGRAGVEVRRSADRAVTTSPGLLSRHSFSFGVHYDPGDVGFGLLLAHNDDEVAPRSGYDEHRHRDVEIVTWVVEGWLRHSHAGGGDRVLGPGCVQRLQAGGGVVHAEVNAGAGPLRFVQVWLPSARPDQPHSYASRCDLADALASGVPVVVASGLARDAGGPGLRLVHHAAALHVVRPVGPVPLPSAPYLHVYVVRGRVRLDGAWLLGEGDAVRITGGPALWVRPADGSAEAEVLVWEMHEVLERPGSRAPDRPSARDADRLGG